MKKAFNRFCDGNCSNCPAAMYKVEPKKHWYSRKTITYVCTVAFIPNKYSPEVALTEDSKTTYNNTISSFEANGYRYLPQGILW